MIINAIIRDKKIENIDNLLDSETKLQMQFGKLVTFETTLSLEEFKEKYREFFGLIRIDKDYKLID